jgi:hypothetical protein
MDPKSVYRERYLWWTTDIRMMLFDPKMPAVTCLPSVMPQHLGKFHPLLNPLSISFHFTSVTGTKNEIESSLFPYFNNDDNEFLLKNNYSSLCLIKIRRTTTKLKMLRTEILWKHWEDFYLSRKRTMHHKTSISIGTEISVVENSRSSRIGHCFEGRKYSSIEVEMMWAKWYNHNSQRDE